MQRNKNYIQAISGMTKRKKIRKGFIPDDVLNKEHDPKDFIEINICTDIRKVRENLKQMEKGRK